MSTAKGKALLLDLNADPEVLTVSTGPKAMHPKLASAGMHGAPRYPECHEAGLCMDRKGNMFAR